jgi:hypothetical protein
VIRRTCHCGHRSPSGEPLVGPARESVFVLVEVDPVASQEEGLGSTTASPGASTYSRALWMREETTVVVSRCM